MTRHLQIQIAVFSMVVGLTGYLVGCNKSDRSTLSRQEALEKNAIDAEVAEEEVARLNAQEKVNEKTGKPEKDAKAAKSAKAAKPAATERKPASRAQNSVYIVQVGAFKVKQNAEKFHQKLKSDGFPVIMRPMQHSKNGEIFVVRMEPTPNRDEALGTMKTLKEKSAVDSQLITRPENE